MLRSDFAYSIGTALLLCAGCSKQASVSESCAVGVCIGDENAHCVTQDCDNGPGWTCAAGLTCRVSTPGAEACKDDSTAAFPCGWEPKPLNPALIREGFDATEGFPVYINDSDTPEITWQSPLGAKYVVCAVFTCDPIITSHTTSVDPQPGLTRIANFDACVDHEYVTAAGFSSVPLYQEPGTFHEITFESCFPPVRDYHQVVSSLSVGCWAYDDTQMIAVSDMIRLSPETLARAFPDFPHDSVCATDGKQCYDSLHSYFGLCEGGECAMRCARAQDCHDAAISLLGEAPSTTCGWSCAPVADSAVGVCARS
jgi:hypothetical protein